MKLRALVLPLIALCGMAFGAYTIARGNQPVPPARPVAEPLRSPFNQRIAASGIVEPSSQEVAIGATLPGIIRAVAATVGDKVQAGAPLFRIDDRDARARLAVARAQLAAAAAELTRLEENPRPETLPPARALVQQRQAELDDARARLETAEAIKDPRAISREEVARRRAGAAAAEAALGRARAELALIAAGAWKADLEVARAKVERERAAVAQVETEIERLTVRAPFDGQVLQVNARVGEFAPAGALQTPLMVYGETETLHVRVDIDEYDAWRFDREAAAVAMLRGNAAIKSPLSFVRSEPLLVPKRSLTGANTERIDTRVLQVIYRFKPAEFPARIGQQVDVFVADGRSKQGEGDKKQ